MGLQKQAKTLSKIQIKLVGDYLTTTRNPYRNTLMFHLSVYAGLRAVEIAKLT
jgi:integrase/recombinase XerD